MGQIPFDRRPAPAVPGLARTVSRRGFLVTSLAAGFAGAAAPLRAEPILTGDDGLVAGEVRVPVAGGLMPAYRASPPGPGPFPTVLVIHEIFGVHEYIRDICRRLAVLGYYAIAGELFARQGDVSTLPDVASILSRVVSKVPDEQVMADLDSMVDFARAEGRADLRRLAVTGFCWGGRATWLYAAHNPALRAAVAWYGMVDPPAWDPKAESVLSVLPRLSVPVLGLYGARDTSIPVAHVDALKEKLTNSATGSRSEIVIYPEVGHAFHADYRKTYDRAAALDGWRRMRDWLRDHGAA
ncbi:MAG: dienelactone hydrolase family protein [Telmatospirillum sp.]|nr:dienelactone hydrolase family protein [Telmatospirillum sp.]